MLPVKIAISVPDTLFEAGERLADERGVSRSELYATALRQYLEAHGDAAITARFDAVYGQQAARIDPAMTHAQLKLVADEAW
jgi:metal-responsive CopG/Arc/MetJ family transcriptional regulator